MYSIIESLAIENLQLQAHKMAKARLAVELSSEDDPSLRRKEYLKERQDYQKLLLEVAKCDHLFSSQNLLTWMGREKHRVGMDLGRNERSVLVELGKKVKEARALYLKSCALNAVKLSVPLDKFTGLRADANETVQLNLGDSYERRKILQCVKDPALRRKAYMMPFEKEVIQRMVLFSECHSLLQQQSQIRSGNTISVTFAKENGRNLDELLYYLNTIKQIIVPYVRVEEDKLKSLLKDDGWDNSTLCFTDRLFYRRRILNAGYASVSTRDGIRRIITLICSLLNLQVEFHSSKDRDAFVSCLIQNSCNVSVDLCVLSSLSHGNVCRTFFIPQSLESGGHHKVVVLIPLGEHSSELADLGSVMHEFGHAFSLIEDIGGPDRNSLFVGRYTELDRESCASFFEQLAWHLEFVRSWTGQPNLNFPEKISNFKASWLGTLVIKALFGLELFNRRNISPSEATKLFSEISSGFSSCFGPELETEWSLFSEFISRGISMVRYCFGLLTGIQILYKLEKMGDLGWEQFRNLVLRGNEGEPISNRVDKFAGEVEIPEMIDFWIST